MKKDAELKKGDIILVSNNENYFIAFFVGYYDTEKTIIIATQSENLDNKFLHSYYTYFKRLDFCCT